MIAAEYKVGSNVWRVRKAVFQSPGADTSLQSAPNLLICKMKGICCNDYTSQTKNHHFSDVLGDRRQTGTYNLEADM